MWGKQQKSTPLPKSELYERVKTKFDERTKQWNDKLTTKTLEIIEYLDNLLENYGSVTYETDKFDWDWRPYCGEDDKTWLDVVHVKLIRHYEEQGFKVTFNEETYKVSIKL